MYQFRAVLRSTNEIISEGHTIDDVEKDIVHFKRQQKHNAHTRGNEKIVIYHMKRHKVFGFKRPAKKLVKIM